MRVVLDAQALTLQQRGGISRYFVELIKRSEVFQRLGLELSTPFKAINNDYAAEQLPERFYRARGVLRRRKLLMPVRAIQLAATRQVDLVHLTYYDPRFLHATRKRPLVCTIYDMIPEKYPELFKRNPHLAKAEVVLRADHVIAISGSARDDLVEIYGVDPENVSVVPLAADGAFSYQPQVVRSQAQLLYVGNRSGYKNFEMLARVMPRLVEAVPEVTLTLAGPPLTAAESVMLINRALADRVHCVQPGDHELVDLYRTATCLVYPSLYEGFGLPVVEAMACGCPVVAARAGSLPEVCGGAALLFDAGSEDDLCHAVLDILQSRSGTAARLTSAGLARAAHYSWDRTARETSSVYARVLGGRRAG